MRVQNQIGLLIFMAFVFSCTKQNSIGSISIESDPFAAGKLNGNLIVFKGNLSTNTDKLLSGNYKPLLSFSSRCNGINFNIIDTLPQIYSNSQGQIPESYYQKVFQKGREIAVNYSTNLDTKANAVISLTNNSQTNNLYSNYGPQIDSKFSIIDTKFMILPNGRLGVKVYAQFNASLYSSASSNSQTSYTLTNGIFVGYFQFWQ
jgi:hypothetical protein